MPKKPIDLTGRKFSKLTVIHCNLPPRNRILAKCECGKEIETRSFDLLNGRTSSCGNTLCSTRSENFLNMRFGFLTVESLSTVKNNRGELVWICKCDCGKKRRVKSYNLKNGLVQSCGCQKDFIKARKRTKPLLEVFINTIFSHYKHGAKNRNFEFKLDKQQFSNFLFQPCYYCGIDAFATYIIKGILGDRDVKYNGIDRLDSSKGYTTDNCISCCKICNVAKSDLTIQEFNEWLVRLIKYQNSQRGN